MKGIRQGWSSKKHHGAHHPGHAHMIVIALVEPILRLIFPVSGSFHRIESKQRDGISVESRHPANRRQKIGLQLAILRMFGIGKRIAHSIREYGRVRIERAGFG